MLGSLVLSALGSSVAAFVQPPCSTTYRCKVTVSGTIRWLPDSSDASCSSAVFPRAATNGVRARTRRRSLVAGTRLNVTLGETPDPSSTSTPHATAFDSACNSAAVEPVEDGPGWSRTETETPTATTTGSSSPLLPLALLNAVTLLWGTQHAVIKLILQGDLSPGMTNFARFGIAALLFSPWTPGLLREPPPLPFSPSKVGDILTFVEDVGEGGNDNLLASDRGGEGGAGAAETWRAGAELGVWMFLGFAFQSIGLGFTTAR